MAEKIYLPILLLIFILAAYETADPPTAPMITAAYFKILTGISTNAVDVHIYNFLAQTGIEVNGCDKAQQMIRETAVLTPPIKTHPLPLTSTYVL